jgi:hypothetical protein
LRVQGWSGPLKELVKALENARSRTYQVRYINAGQAREREEQSRLVGDDLGEMMSSIKPLLASGYGVADGVGALNNDLFSFEPEDPEKVFRRVFEATG